MPDRNPLFCTLHSAFYILHLESGCNVSSRRPRSERGGRRCNSCHPDHFWKAGRYKLAAPVLKTGSAQTRGRSITDAFRHFGRMPTLNRNTQRKEIPCDLLSVTKASCSIARATNQVVSFGSDRSRSRTSFFVRCDGLVQSRN